jgi:hypothetical protein
VATSHFPQSGVATILALMLDLMFKSLRVVENYVGCGVCICLVAEYDANGVIPLLMIVFELLNLFVQACVVEVVRSVTGFGDSIEKDNNIFSVGASMEETSCALVVVELSLFERLFISLVTCVDPLAWWWIHETQFPNVNFLAKQILGILGSHIETERVFNLASGLTTLRRCKLKVDNLDRIITMVKNWPNNPLNCSQHKGLIDFLKVEFVLAKDNYDLIEESNYFEQLEPYKD